MAIEHSIAIIVLCCIVLSPRFVRGEAPQRVCAMYIYIRQFGIILEQCYLFVVLNTISFDCLRFVVKEAICTDSRNEVHQEIVNGSVS